MVEPLVGDGGRDDPSPKRRKMAANNRGRVRTGCLVCRARKVKCDERRPTCHNCTRLRKSCAYKITGGDWGGHPPTPPRDPNPASSGDWEQQQQEHHHQVGGTTTVTDSAPGFPDKGNLSNSTSPFQGTSPSVHGDMLAIANAIPTGCDLPGPSETENLSPTRSADTFNQAGSVTTVDDLSNRFHQTSQLICLTTVMDWLAASEAPTLSSFCYFTDVVDCPLLSPLEHLNWPRVKQHIARLGLEQTSVAECMLAVQTVYRAQVERLPMAHAMSIYRAAVSNFEIKTADNSIDFDLILVGAFLLCLCAVTLPNEDSPQLDFLGVQFETRLGTWLVGGSRAPVSLRICAWLQLLNTTAKRPGSAGLLPTSVLNLLYRHVGDPPSLSALDTEKHPERYLYDSVSSPLFAFYLKLQSMSNRVADVTHYRRSRSTPADQAEVTDLMDALKVDLFCLWDHRPAPLQLQPDQIREHFSGGISTPLIALAGVCIAAFHAEIIVIGRILGDSPFPSPDAEQSRSKIREVVSRGWNVPADGGLSPAYIRPLFVYALESVKEDESAWAAEQLRRVNHPISRGSFLASFVEAHGRAQRAQSRRVTMKYFCYQTFGVPLPFM